MYCNDIHGFYERTDPKMTELDLNPYFKAIVEVEPSAIVICDTDHKIIYMNPAAHERYKNRGGDHLMGSSVLDCHREPHSREMIVKILEWFKASPENNVMYMYHKNDENKDLYMLALRDDEGKLLGYYEKHHCIDRETKAPYEGL